MASCTSSLDPEVGPDFPVFFNTSHFGIKAQRATGDDFWNFAARERIAKCGPQEAEVAEQQMKLINTKILGIAKAVDAAIVGESLQQLIAKRGWTGDGVHCEEIVQRNLECLRTLAFAETENDEVLQTALSHTAGKTELHFLPLLLDFPKGRAFCNSVALVLKSRLLSKSQVAEWSRNVADMQNAGNDTKANASNDEVFAMVVMKVVACERFLKETALDQHTISKPTITREVVVASMVSACKM